MQSQIFDPSTWYGNKEIIDFMLAASERDKRVKLCPYKSFDQSMRKPNNMADKIIVFPDITTSIVKTNVEDKSILIRTINDIIAKLATLQLLPQHVRSIINIATSHFVATDIEFDGLTIKFSYLNTLTGYNTYDDLIINTFKEALIKHFPQHKLICVHTIDNIQQNYNDCGVMALEWISLGINTPKLPGANPANTPYLEITENNAAYMRHCGLNSRNLRDIHKTLMSKQTKVVDVVDLTDDSDLADLSAEKNCQAKMAIEADISTHKNSQAKTAVDAIDLTDDSDAVKDEISTAGPNKRKHDETSNSVSTSVQDSVQSSIEIPGKPSVLAAMLAYMLKPALTPGAAPTSTSDTTTPQVKARKQ